MSLEKLNDIVKELDEKLSISAPIVGELQTNLKLSAPVLLVEAGKGVVKSEQATAFALSEPAKILKTVEVDRMEYVKRVIITKDMINKEDVEVVMKQMINEFLNIDDIKKNRVLESFVGGMDTLFTFKQPGLGTYCRDTENGFEIRLHSCFGLVF